MAIATTAVAVAIVINAVAAAAVGSLLLFGAEFVARATVVAWLIIFCCRIIIGSRIVVVIRRDVLIGIVVTLVGCLDEESC